MLLIFLLWPPVIWGQTLPGEEAPDALKQLAPSYDETDAPFFLEEGKQVGGPTLEHPSASDGPPPVSLPPAGVPVRHVARGVVKGF